MEREHKYTDHRAVTLRSGNETFWHGGGGLLDLYAAAADGDCLQLVLISRTCLSCSVPALGRKGKDSKQEVGEETQSKGTNRKYDRTTFTKMFLF